jgi:hypothetical protein
MAARHDRPARRRPTRSRVMIACSIEQGKSMNAKGIRAALRRERLYEPAGAVYSLDNGVPVSRKLAAELINTRETSGRPVSAAERGRVAPRLHADVARGRMSRALTSTTATLTDFGTSLEPFDQRPPGSQRVPWKIMLPDNRLDGGRTRTRTLDPLIKSQRLEFVELSLHKPLLPECLWREYNAFL